METFEVKANNHHYTVTFAKCKSLIEPLLQQEHVFWIIDMQVFQLYQERFSNIPDSKRFLLHAIEEHKSMDTVLSIAEKMAEGSCNRRTELVAVGGGLTLDVAGFLASIYMRGISYTSIPTTLLAAADSCLGGKTAVNSCNVKNLLGTFYPPKSIIIDAEFLKSLSYDDFKSGVGEILKIALISGEDHFLEFEADLDKLLTRDNEMVLKYIARSLLFKKNVVEQDECEKGLRRVLNYGHTFGHAVEVVSQYKVPHGKAIAIGIMMVNRLAVAQQKLREETAMRIAQQIEKIYGEVASQIPSTESLYPIMLRDKKNTTSSISYVFIGDDFLPIL